MQIDDKLVLAGFAVLSGAIAALWNHQRRRERECDDRIRVMWSYISSLMGWPEPPESIRDTGLAPKTRNSFLYTSKHHPKRRKTDRE